MDICLEQPLHNVFLSPILVKNNPFTSPPQTGQSPFFENNPILILSSPFVFRNSKNHILPPDTQQGGKILVLL